MPEEKKYLAGVLQVIVLMIFLPSCRPYLWFDEDSGGDKSLNQEESSSDGVRSEFFYPEDSAIIRKMAAENAKLMAEAGRIGIGSKVLEIGTGSGFEAAYFSLLGARVYSVEIVSETADLAKSRLKQSGFETVEIKVGDGWQGWLEKAPFDSIIIRASSPSIPAKLLSQLANRGRLVVPIEKRSEKSSGLLVVERDGNDFVTHFREATVGSKLSGEVRTIPEVNIETPNGFSLIQKMLEGGN